jgi:hypothetical protein
MTRKTIDYARLGEVVCEAFVEGPAAFADFVRTTLSVAAAVHAVQATTRDKQPDLTDSITPLSETRH